MTMRFFIAEKLSAHKALTPEGFLVIEAVPICRVGPLLYGPGETPVSDGPDGMVKIEREPEEVFRPETIASFAGKAVTIEHPDEDVTPANWSQLAVGTIMSPRRGEGVLDDCVLADLVITHERGLRFLEENPNCQVSCGYDAEYDEMAPGHGRQRDIIGNHLALLMEQGRCGPRCAIKDHDTIRPTVMSPSVHTTTTHAGAALMAKKTWLDKVRDAFKARDEGMLNEALSEGEGTMTPLNKTEGEDHGAGGYHIHLSVPGSNPAANRTMPEGGQPGTGDLTTSKASDDMPAAFQQHVADMSKWRDEMSKWRDEMTAAHKAMCDKINAMGTQAPPGTGDEAIDDPKVAEEPDREVEGQLKEEAPPGTNDAHKARDSAFLVDSFTETLQLAEILAPGITLPKFDKAQRPARTLDAMCKTRVAALKAAYATAEGRALIEGLAGRTVDVDSMSCSAMSALFRAAGNTKRTRNNDMTRGNGVLATESKPTGVSTLADLNKLNAEYFAKHAR